MKVFDLTPDDYPNIHVEADFLYPAHRVYQDYKHLFDEPIMRKETITSGCNEQVLPKECSPNPRKVKCPGCREYAAMMHDRMARMYEFLRHEQRSFDDDKNIARQLLALVATHDGHATMFREPFTGNYQ